MVGNFQLPDWSYMKQNDLCDEHSEMSGNSYLADLLVDLPPVDLPVDLNGNLRFLLLELILADQLADLPPKTGI